LRNRREIYNATISHVVARMIVSFGEIPFSNENKYRGM
jgi:hypothetical protein